ncbi:hypothetical protein GO988_19375 [Hymenobacter sp. HMF4947]|uniref:SCO family protein n=1 Tax=Hymenobacter ginkgonis TaxID=2682976 RepID=A0A7K1TJB0_9BACT|nr:hypothetical protein [Hymenobacter ginkgonis]MVN78498.1 hypothetical protein [Hymenobacter ginkgonis]
MLGLLLLVPVLAFLFLYGFGRNHYALPTYLPERTEPVRSATGGQRDTVFHRVRSFRLRGVGGRYVSATELGQGMYVVQFFGTGEANAEVTRYLARLQEKFRREPRVRLATLVPSPEGVGSLQAAVSLEKLSEQYGTISGKWFFLTAPADTLQQLASQEFGVTTLQPAHLPFRPTTEPGNLPLGRLLLIDHDQHVRGYYDGTDIHEIERLITEINVLLYTYDHSH